MRRYLLIFITLSFLHSFYGCALFSFSLRSQKLNHLENNYALKCINLNLWHEAKYHLERAYQLNPNSSAVNNNLAVTYEYFNEIDKAKLYYQNAIKLSPHKSYKENLNLFLKENKSLDSLPSQ
ncbi:hypothetical protein KKB54_02775 [bacterium]|nr:hypothetical protein [bacterium]MBU0899724.1 hypothetical protein [bacterium]MBU1153674.1 hypothetical protein [bacterium]MBU2599325.1 hypothetical protein [bacterium]